MPHLQVSLLEYWVGSTIFLMATLYIDTSNSEKIIVKFGDLEVVEDSKKEKSQKLLAVIDHLMRENKKEWKDISSIHVNPGPGSFTGLRVGVAVANALGWVLGIMVNDKDVRQEGPVEPVYS